MRQLTLEEASSQQGSTISETGATAAARANLRSSGNQATYHSLTMSSYGATYGALFIGSLVAMYLSGIVATQVLHYFRCYPNDPNRIRYMVILAWTLELAHSCFVCITVWHYVIGGLSNSLTITHIFWSTMVTISLTGMLTFVIHCFYTMRVWTLSKHNKRICSLIMVLAFLRLLSASGTVTQMARLHTWARFRQDAEWIFTTGLVISATVDFLIAFSLLYYLRKSRTGFSSMDQVIDSIMVLTIENGLLTSVSVAASFVCWLTMPHNFVFLGLHFAITKAYTISFLASLNARRMLQDKTSSTVEEHKDYRSRTLSSSKTSNRHSDMLQISIDKSVHCVTEVGTVDIEAVSMIEPAYLKQPSGESH